MEQAAVLGAGLMGHSIALQFAWAGFNAALLGMDEAELLRAEKEIRSKLDILSEHGLLGASSIDEVVSRIRFTTELEGAAAGATFLIEAIPEDLQLKIDFFRRLDRICPPDSVLASNTSGLSPTAIASEMRHPERMVVTHFWNPAHLIPLVEVVRGEKTGDDTVRRAMELLTSIRKRPIEVKKDVPGSVGNRLQYALFREAQHLLAEGVASMEDIDAAVTYGLGRRLPVTGPFMTADMGGLDVFHSISTYLFPDLSKVDGSYSEMKALVEAGKFGQKNGGGFYEWDPEASREMSRRREEELIRFLKRDFGGKGME